MAFGRVNMTNLIKYSKRWLTIGYSALFLLVLFNVPSFSQTSPNAMIVDADQLLYDMDNKIVTAKGKVKIYYENRTLEADKVIYNQNTDRMRAVGNVRITDLQHNVTTGSEMDIDKGFSDGFLKAMNYETADRTYIGSMRGKREVINGEKTATFEKATYTACEPCKDNPQKPPLWQIKATKVVHKEDEQTIYFHHARLEFLDIPLLYVPYFWVPDHNTKRKSGFLSPTISNSNILGIGVEIPYYYVYSDNIDFTFAPTYYTKQGVLLKGEWNYGTDEFKNVFRFAGINQKNPSTFNFNSGAFPYFEAPGARDTRFYAQTTGNLLLSPKWNLGWDIIGFSDRTFMRDYNISAIGASEANSTISLTGQGDRSFFEMKAVRYQGLAAGDRQSEIPMTFPQIDYFKVHNKPLWGGELSYRGNANVVMRQQADFDVRNDRTMTDTLWGRTYDGCDSMTPASAVATSNNRFDCLLRGIGGTYGRFSAEAQWRKRIFDKAGQIWEPFASFRTDIAALDLRPNNDVSSYFGNQFLDRALLIRLMPTLGMTYRYPWVSNQKWGQTIVEPVAQLVLRPNEMAIGKMPNEDAQSLVFDDSTLFAPNKFSGWDRSEGGGRLNYGLNFTTRLNNGFYFNALFGQSRHLFGINSYLLGDPNNSTGYIDMAGTGANSGLDKPRSDYVARLQLRPMQNMTFSARFRFDEATWKVMRTEVDASILYKNISFVATYADYAERPLLGFNTVRKGIGGALGYKFYDNYTAFFAARYDLDLDRLDGISTSLNYLDDCYFMSAQYSRAFAYAPVGGTKPPDDHRFLLRVGLRTVGDTKYSRSVLQ